MSPHIKSRYLFRTFIIILIVELLIIPSLHFLHLSEWYTEAFINVLLMTLLTYPLLKSFVMSPLIRELETQCRLTQKKLNDARLEQEIAGELEAELIHKIEFQNTYTRTIFDGVDAIVIATDGEHIQEANRSFFNFFSEYPDLAAFKHDHDCICDFFEVTAEDGFVYKNINGELWSDYILKDPERNHKVAIWRDGKRFIMSIKAKKVLFEETKMVIASFYDITALENYKNKLESMVDEKTAELSLTLRSMQDNDMKLRAITDSVQDGIILLDQKGELVFMNPGAKKLLGYEEEELRGKEFHRIVVSEEYYDAYRKGYAHFIQTGQGEVIGRTLELKAIKKNGEHIPVSLSTNSVLLKGKWHAVGLLHDITQRKRYENALLENKNRLQAAIRTSGVGIYDYPIPLDHRAYWSEEWAGIFGFSKTDLPSWEGMIQWISERIHPDDRSAYLSKLEALFHDGTAYNLTKRMRHKSGRWVTVSSVAAVVERNENGTPKRAIGAIQDISDTVAILDELRRNKERFQHLVEDINDWIWEVDGEGNFTYSSPKVISLLDYTPEELIGTSPFILMPEEERQRLAGLLQHLVDSGHPLESLENTLRHKNGKLVTIETNAQPILDEAGKVMGYRGINRDITDRKKLEEELRQKEKLMLAQSRQAAMGDMIAMIAHQWRQPISTISMASNNILLDSYDRPPVASTDHCHRNGRKQSASLDYIRTRDHY